MLLKNPSYKIGGLNNIEVDAIFVQKVGVLFDLHFPFNPLLKLVKLLEYEASSSIYILHSDSNYYDKIQRTAYITSRLPPVTRKILTLRLSKEFEIKGKSSLSKKN